jgi:uncharacterized protein (DUF2252 family)
MSMTAQDRQVRRRLAILHHADEVAGSVGTRCYVVLLHGRDDGDLLLIQVKEATDSVLARAHARSGDSAMIAGYIGTGATFARRSLLSLRPTPTRQNATTASFSKPSGTA